MLWLKVEGTPVETGFKKKKKECSFSHLARGKTAFRVG